MRNGILLVTSLFVFIFSVVSQEQQSTLNSFYATDFPTLSEEWELSDTLRFKNSFRVTPYKPVYFLLFNYSNNINNQPTSGNPINVVPDQLDYDNSELKFQLSFKSKIVNLSKYGALWIGFTQTSRWQVYNVENSRPFRETNYEPEFMYIIPTKFRLFGLNGVYSGIGIAHQSNGRSNPFSRSWNRVIFQLGMESKKISLVLKPWIRFSEDLATDDNPDIENYIGRGELIFKYRLNKYHHLSFIGRHSLKFNDDSRGAFQLDHAWRIFKQMKSFHIHTQIFSGYGESLIDFNHHQTTVGIGFSLIN